MASSSASGPDSARMSNPLVSFALYLFLFFYLLLLLSFLPFSIFHFIFFSFSLVLQLLPRYDKEGQAHKVVGASVVVVHQNVAKENDAAVAWLLGYAKTGGSGEAK